MNRFRKMNDCMKGILIFSFFLATLLSVFSCKSEWDTENVTELTELLGAEYTFYSDDLATQYCGKRYYRIGDEIFMWDLPRSFNGSHVGYEASGWKYLSNPSDGSTAIPENISLNDDGTIYSIRISPEPVYLYADSWVAKSNTPYTVYHYVESVDGFSYDLREAETLYGSTDGSTLASAYSYPGFTSQPFSQGTINGDGSTVIDIYYTRNTITYTFNLDGGTWSLPTTLSGKYEESLNAEIPTMTGYTLAGWSTATDWYPTLPSTFGPYDETFTASWNLGEYEIKFDSSGGSGSMSPQGISYGGSVTLNPNTFTKEHCVFEGWTTIEGGTLVEYADEDSFSLTGDSSITLYAVWTSISRTVSFNANGGTGSMAPQTLEYGETITLRSNTFTREHYNFSGWSTTTTGSYEYLNNDVFSLTGDEDVTLYAVWSPDLYKISFSANGGYGLMDPQYIYYNDPDPLYICNYTRPGFTFNKWTTQADGSGAAYTDGASFSPTEATELYAQWTPEDFVVSFDGNGGSGSVANITVPYLTQKNLTLNSFTRTGYEFAGWSTSATGSVEYGNGGIYTMLNPENVTLYAVWEPTTYRVYFYPNGGSGNISFQQFEYGVAQNLDSNTFTRAHYTFKGWASSPTATTVSYTDEASYTLPATPPVAIYLYALWEPETYTVTFDSNGATEGSMSPQTFTYGTPDTLTPNAFGKDTCGFSYWNTAADGSGTSYEDEEEISISEDITLYAMWAMFSNIHYDIENSDISITSSESGSKITFTADSGYDSYGWIFDTALSGKCTSVGNIMTVETSGLWNGTYSVTVYAQKGTMIYSCQATITVD